MKGSRAPTREFHSLSEFLVTRKTNASRAKLLFRALPDEDFPERGNNNQASKQNHEQAEEDGDSAGHRSPVEYQEKPNCRNDACQRDSDQDVVKLEGNRMATVRTAPSFVRNQFVALWTGYERHFLFALGLRFTSYR